VLLNRKRVVDPGTVPSARVIHQSGSAFVVRLQWCPREASDDVQRFQMLATRDGKIYEMRDYRTERDATKAARARAAG
jgi:hypothetical protein